MLEIGINLNNECGKNDAEKLKLVKKVGFKNLMLSFQSKDIEDTIKKTQKMGLNVSYYHLNNIIADDLWVKGLTNDEYIKYVFKQLELCGKYNIPIAVMHATIGNPTDFVIEPNEHGLNCMKRIVDVARKNNVKIALENVDGSSFKYVKFLLDNIKSENLGFCYDLGHHQLYNSKIDMLKMYGDRLFALHIHDNLMDYEIGYDYTRDLHWLPFDGKINFEKFIKKLKDVKYNGILMLEVHKELYKDQEMYRDIKNEDFIKEAMLRVNKLNQLMEEI